MINLKDLRAFQQFLTLLAGRIGQVVNYTSLSNDVGVSAMTVKNWISVLLASFVVFELKPFFENIRKRVIKSPKVYFTDIGLVASLLGIETPEQAFRDPLRGGLYENLVILEVLKAHLNAGRRPDLFFYRDTHGNEVDLIIKSGRTLIPVEIKSGATFTPDFIKGIHRFKKIAGERFKQSYVIYNGTDRFAFQETSVFNPFVHGGIEAM